MKKLIALFLMVSLCLALVACGGRETPNTNDNSGTQQGEQIDNEIVESDNSSTEQSEQVDGEIAESDNTENTESPYANHSLLEHLYGEWEVYTDYSEPFTTFTINNDGKCVVDGLDATWRIADMYTTDDNLYIEIYNNDEHLGGIMVWGNDDVVVQGVGTNYGFTQGYYNKVSN